MKNNITLKEFINKIPPHNINNGHPPNSGEERHDWESKLLFSVYNKLNDKCSVLDYGCGSKGTLQYNLFSRYPDAKYYGLDIKGKFPIKSNSNVYMGLIEELPEKSKEVDCIVAGSVFSHLSWEGIKNVLDKLDLFFKNGGEFGFTTILNSKYELLYPDYYGKDTYGMAILTKDQYQKYCDDNNLTFEVLSFSYPLLNSPYKKQTYCNIKKK